MAGMHGSSEDEEGQVVGEEGELPYADVFAAQLGSSEQPQESNHKACEEADKVEGVQGADQQHTTPMSSLRHSSEDSDDDEGSRGRSRGRGWRTQQRSPSGSPGPRRGRYSSRGRSRSRSSSRSSSWDPYSQPGRMPREPGHRTRDRHRSRSRSRLRGRSRSLSPVGGSRRPRSRSRSVSREGRGHLRSPHTVPRRWEGRSRHHGRHHRSPSEGARTPGGAGGQTTGGAAGRGGSPPEPQLDTLFVGDLPPDVTAQVGG
jgi:hypothetical protein